MYQLIKNYFKFDDERGSIEGLLNFGNWEEANLVKSMANTTRGGHYHAKTKEFIYILDGEIEATFEREGKKDTIILKKNDAILINEYTFHTFTAKQKASWINLLSKKIDSKNPDILK